MSDTIDDIIADAHAIVNKLDNLRSGKCVEQAFLIERAEDILNEFIRYDLDIIEKAIKGK